jgi:hypothetical protein
VSQPPAQPKIFHITHVSNLPAIAACSELRSDRRVQQLGGPIAAVGMSKIKQRRLSLPVSCHPGTTVGEFVPFYFGPRSIMLFLLHRGNHPELNYAGGQQPIVHLQADLHAVLQWAAQHGQRWAFTAANAGAAYTQFYAQSGQLNVIDWSAVNATDFRDPGIKERKQAEFLVYGAFPWTLVERIGVCSVAARSQALAAMANAVHRPQVTVDPSWYF